MEIASNRVKSNKDFKIEGNLVKRDYLQKKLPDFVQQLFLIKDSIH